MLIQVNYGGDKYDYVKDFMLDALIETGAIALFRRRTGWVRVGVDPVRKPHGRKYSGEERRIADA